MPALTNDVGEQGVNLWHDVALIQVMLRFIRDPKGQPYVSFNYDGVFTKGGATSKALQALQADYKIKQQNPQEPLGTVKKDSLTFTKMVELLPATHKELMTIEGLKVVYFAGSMADKMASESFVTTHPKFSADFKTKLGAVIRQMYEKYKIVLSAVKGSGGFRDFAMQRHLMDVVINPATGEKATDAGPGESNHNFGNGADLGLSGFTWVQRNSQPKKDDDWLNSLNKTDSQSAAMLWKLRNALAIPPLFPSQKPGDIIHLQTFDDHKVYMPKSLAQLMSAHGSMWWDCKKSVYTCNFGLADSTEMLSVSGGAGVPVTAKNLWDKKTNVSEANLAKALNQALKRRAAAGKLEDYEETILQAFQALHATPLTEFKADDIKKAHCNLARDLLKADFDQAEANYMEWKPFDRDGKAL